MKKEQFYILPYLMICLYAIWRSIGYKLHDFATYYYAGWLTSNDLLTSEIYFPQWFNQAIRNVHEGEFLLSFSPNSPVLALVFAPFSIVDPFVAKLIWNLLSVVLFTIAIYQFKADQKLDEKVWLWVIIGAIPIYYSIRFGQVYLMLVALLIFSVVYYRQRKFFLADFLFAFAILIKVFPAILLLYFVKQRAWKRIATVMIMTFSLVSLSALILGPQIWIDYFQVLIRAEAGFVQNGFQLTGLSAFATVKGLLVADFYSNPNPLILDSYPLFKVCVLVLKVALLITYFSYKGSHLADISLLILIAVAWNSYLPSYGLLILIIPLLAYAKEYARFPILALVPIGLLCSWPVVVRFVPWTWMAILPGLVLIGTLFYFPKCLKVLRSNRYALIFLTSIVSVLAFSSDWKSPYNYQLPIVKADFMGILNQISMISDDSLEVSVWTESGLNQARFGLTDQLKKADQSNPDSRKLLVRRIVLSDKGRGEGFFIPILTEEK